MLRGPVLVTLLSLLPVIVKASVCTDHLASFDCPNGGVCTQWNDGCKDCACIENELNPSCTFQVCPCEQDSTCPVPTCTENPDCVFNGTTTVDTTTTEGDPTEAEDNQEESTSPAPDTATGNEDDPRDVQGDDNNNQGEQEDTPPDAETTDDIVKEYNSGNQTMIPTEQKQYLDLFNCDEGDECQRWSDGCNNCEIDSQDRQVITCSVSHCPCYDDDTPACVPVCWDNAWCLPIDPYGSPYSGGRSSNAQLWWSALSLVVFLGFVL